MNVVERLRQAIQAVLDATDTDGWQVSEFVVAMGIERMRPDGSIEATSWVWAPPEQPDWQISGLLQAALDTHATADYED